MYFERAIKEKAHAFLVFQLQRAVSSVGSLEPRREFCFLVLGNVLPPLLPAPPFFTMQTRRHQMGRAQWSEVADVFDMSAWHMV